MENFRIAELPKSQWNGPNLTGIKCIHSVEEINERPGTIITLSTIPSSPFTTSTKYVTPTEPYCVTSLLAMESKMVPPFRATFKGTVINVQPPTRSQQNLPKVVFELVDELGYYIVCCAIGRNAQNRSLANGNQVIIYHGNARGPLGSEPAMVYLMKDALVVPLEFGLTTPNKVKKIELAQN